MKAVFDTFVQFKAKSISKKEEEEGDKVDVRANVKKDSPAWILMEKKVEYVPDFEF